MERSLCAAPERLPGTPLVYRRSRRWVLGLDGLRGSPGSVACGRIIGLIHPRDGPAKTISVTQAWGCLTGDRRYAAWGCHWSPAALGVQPGEGSPEVRLQIQWGGDWSKPWS